MGKVVPVLRLLSTKSQGEVIAWAQIVIFAILSLPSLVCIIRHKRHGLLGWIPLNGFCILRVVGGILTIHDYKTTGVPSIATAIIAGLGIAPILIAAEGVLHEARQARQVAFRTWLEWFCVIHFHAAAAIGAVLIATRGQELSNPNRSSSSQAVIDLGLFILLGCWGFLVLFTLLSSLRKPKDQIRGRSKKHKGTKRLLWTVTITLPISLVRVLYGIIYYVSKSTNFEGSIAARVILDVVPEMAFVAIMVIGGLSTFNMYTHRNRSDAVAMETYRSGM